MDWLRSKIVGAPTVAKTPTSSSSPSPSPVSLARTQRLQLQAKEHELKQTSAKFEAAIENGNKQEATFYRQEQKNLEAAIRDLRGKLANTEATLDALRHAQGNLEMARVTQATNQELSAVNQEMDDIDVTSIVAETRTNVRVAQRHGSMLSKPLYDSGGGSEELDDEVDQIMAQRAAAKMLNAKQDDKTVVTATTPEQQQKGTVNTIPL